MNMGTLISSLSTDVFPVLFVCLFICLFFSIFVFDNQSLDRGAVDRMFTCINALFANMHDNKGCVHLEKLLLLF